MEMQSQLLICKDIRLIETETASKLEQEVLEISGLLQELVHFYKHDTGI